ncbi:MAG TPA: hypothetical protein VM577_05360 [Anaerovoracaceae bacterium]|nr:hypothetical protein [Anaerovoracaceae bacterium]
MKNVTRFTFVRNSNGRPVGCIAYRMDGESGTLNYEVSTHNPKDEYDRATARFVAEGRLNKHPRQVRFNPRMPPKLDTLLDSAVEDLIWTDTARDDVKYVPARLKKALLLRQEFLAEQRAERRDTMPSPSSATGRYPKYNPGSEF